MTNWTAFDQRLAARRRAERSRVQAQAEHRAARVDQARAANAELLARDGHHPSVFVWSICNESAFGYGFERSHEWLRKTDPSRPNAGSYDRGSLEILARLPSWVRLGLVRADSGTVAGTAR